jgi:hypothetical protein
VDCSFAKDFAGPLATVVAAGAAVWVTAHFSSQQAETARRQAATARSQLRLNLFDKRYAVYKDIERRLWILLNDKSETLDLQIPLKAPDKSETALEVAQLFVALDEAAFFFPPTTCEWLETVRELCRAFFAANAMRREGPGNPKQYAALEIQILEHIVAMPKRFLDDLSFSQPTSD